MQEKTTKFSEKCPKVPAFTLPVLRMAVYWSHVAIHAHQFSVFICGGWWEKGLVHLQYGFSVQTSTAFRRWLLIGEALNFSDQGLTCQQSADIWFKKLRGFTNQQPT